MTNCIKIDKITSIYFDYKVLLATVFIKRFKTYYAETFYFILNNFCRVFIVRFYVE